MLSVNKVLCPTDFSEPSLEALEKACAIAQHFSTEMLLVHVVTPIPVIPIHVDPTSFNVPLYEKEREASAHQSLDKIVKQKIPASIKARAMVYQGDPAVEIVRVASVEQVDVIVIATYGLTGWRKFIFGSVTEKVIRMASCPVLSLRAGPQKD
jgi:universal stress protein A